MEGDRVRGGRGQAFTASQIVYRDSLFAEALPVLAAPERPKGRLGAREDRAATAIADLLAGLA